jgi:hypothetical protein
MSLRRLQSVITSGKDRISPIPDKITHQNILFFLSDFGAKRADQLNILGVFLWHICGPFLGFFLKIDA